MDKKTKILLLVEVILVVALVVIVAADYKSKTSPEAVVAVSQEAPEAAKETAAHGEAAKEEAAPAQEAVTEEKAAPAAEEKAETPEKKAEAKTEAVEEKAEPKEEKPAAAPEEKAAPAKAAPAAGSGAAQDVIALEEAYPHTKGIVQFSHKKHFEEYKITCGDCHHDDTGKPLADLKAGDPVQGCFACHSKPGKAGKAEGGEKMDPAQKLEYHAEALHLNCIECHKDFNKKNNTKDAPVTCAQCHPKTS